MKEPEKVKLTQAEGEALIERIKANALTESDRGVLERLIHMYFWLLFTLQEAKLSLKRLKVLLFGKAPPAETKAKGSSPNDEPPGPAGKPPGEPDSPAGDDSALRDDAERDAAGRRQRGGGKPAGQGRQSAEAYLGAERVLCRLEEPATGSERKGAKLLQSSNLVVEPDAGVNRFVILKPFPAGVASNRSA